MTVLSRIGRPAQTIVPPLSESEAAQISGKLKECA